MDRYNRGRILIKKVNHCTYIHKVLFQKIFFKKDPKLKQHYKKNFEKYFFKKKLKKRIQVTLSYKMSVSSVT